MAGVGPPSSGAAGALCEAPKTLRLDRDDELREADNTAGDAGCSACSRKGEAAEDAARDICNDADASCLVNFSSDFFSKSAMGGLANVAIVEEGAALEGVGAAAKVGADAD